MPTWDQCLCPVASVASVNGEKRGYLTLNSPPFCLFYQWLVPAVLINSLCDHLDPSSEIIYMPENLIKKHLLMSMKNSTFK